MYSMYTDFYKKIKNTINRPRFFYMNLIEPRLYNTYSSIVYYYDNYFLKNKKSLFIYICFLALQFNFGIKNKFSEKKIFFRQWIH
jgi:hypothetical protein